MRGLDYALTSRDFASRLFLARRGHTASQSSLDLQVVARSMMSKLAKSPTPVVSQIFMKRAMEHPAKRSSNITSPSDRTSFIVNHHRGGEAAVNFDPEKPWEWAVRTGFQLPKLAEYVPSYNVIKPDVGKGGYVRVTAGINNEELYHQAAHSSLMTMGGQHPVGCNTVIISLFSSHLC